MNRVTFSRMGRTCSGTENVVAAVIGLPSPAKDAALILASRPRDTGTGLRQLAYICMVRRAVAVMVVPALLVSACTSSGHARGPCTLLSAADVARVTGSRVAAVRNVPSIKNDRIRLCSYETRGRFGAITV